MAQGNVGVGVKILYCEDRRLNGLIHSAFCLLPLTPALPQLGGRESPPLPLGEGQGEGEFRST